jgi:hypothetical protein
MLPHVMPEVNEVILAVVCGRHFGIAMVVAWTGGQPKFDWFGLEDDPQSYTTPNQLYPVSGELAQVTQW